MCVNPALEDNKGATFYYLYDFSCSHLLCEQGEIVSSNRLDHFNQFQ